MVGLKGGGQIYVMGWQSATSKLVTSGEAAATFQSMGFADAIKLDGGGSFAFQIAQSGQKTSENRRINSVLRFGGADIQPQNPDQPNAPDYERWKSYMARWEAEKAALPASQWAQASLEQAKAKGLNYKVGKFPMSANGKALILNGGEGLVKIIAGREYGEVLGMHIIGPRATDLICEGALAIGSELTLDELAATIHSHPTVTETMRECALDALGRAVHIPPRRK